MEISTNLRGYDGHLLIRAVKKRHGNIRVIPNNVERYLGISIDSISKLNYDKFPSRALFFNKLEERERGGLSPRRTSVENVSLPDV